MKIPTSSSIFLATLAISSSSTSLAAPAGDAPAGNSVSTPQNSTSYPDGGASDGHVQARSKEYVNVEARNAQLVPAIEGTIEGIPIVGPILKNLLGASGPPSEQDISSLQSATDQLKGALGTVGSTASSLPLPLPSAATSAPGTVAGTVGQVGSHLPGPAGAAAGTLDAKDQNDGGPSGASASATPTASAAAADAPSGSATPSATPSAPPNSPTLPVNV